MQYDLNSLMKPTRINFLLQWEKISTQFETFELKKQEENEITYIISQKKDY